MVAPSPDAMGNYAGGLINQVQLYSDPYKHVKYPGLFVFIIFHVESTCLYAWNPGLHECQITTLQLLKA